MSAHILLLEDDQHMRAALVQVLTDQGYEVTAVTRGEEAVEKARAHSFDLIVADIRMEGMGGLEAVAQTKQHQPDIGSLLVTGYASEEETSRARDLRVGGYLKKPFRMRKLVELVNQQLAARRTQQRRQARGSNHRRISLWALGELARLADREGVVQASGTLARAAGLAESLAGLLELEPEVAQELGVATMLLPLRDRLGWSCEPLLDDPSLLPVVASVLSPPDPEAGTPVEVALADLCWTACQDRPDDELPEADELAKRYPGRFEPELLADYQRVRQSRPQVADSQALPGHEPRSLLGLARTLERVGDHEAAERAYREVLAASRTRRSGVEARLGLGRLALAARSPEQALQLVEEATAAARSLGPVAKAGAQLEAGLTLLQLEAEEAGEVLRAARDGYDRLGLSAGAALASVALARLGEVDDLAQRLAALVAGARSPEVEAALAWLWPSLLELSGQLEYDSAVLGLVGQLSWSLEALLAQGRLSRDHKLRLLEILEAGGGFGPEGLVARLSQDSDSELAGRAAGLGEEATSAPAAPTVRVSSFGYFTVQIGGKVLSDREWRTQKTRYLFAYLANPWGSQSHSEAVLEAFWPEDLMKARQAMYWSISTARRVMREHSDELSELIVRDGDNLCLAAEIPHWHDVEEFERAYEAARAADQEGRHPEAQAGYREAVELYRGPYLEGCFFDWALERRRDYTRKCSDALARLAAAAATREDHDLTLEYAQRWLEQSPHAQDAHLLVMNTYLKTGRPELAIEQFRRCEKLLRSEYELEPVTELIEAYYRARLEMP